MTALTLHVDSSNFVPNFEGYRGPRNEDYYEGELTIKPSDEVSVRIESSLNGDFKIYRLESNADLVFRRTWQHIRADRTDVATLWFVVKGTMRVTDSGGSHLVNAGESSITRSLTPFVMECLAEASGDFEALHLVVPTHILREYVPDEVGTEFKVSTEHGSALIAENIIGLLFQEDGYAEREIAEQFVRSALVAIGRTIGRTSRYGAVRQSIGDRRYDSVTAFISRNLSNSDLRQSMVAKGCGISVRYLCHLLRQRGTSFSNLLWDQRVGKAYEWLRDSQMRTYSVSEIAYLTGFKSPAHFSRMFKKRYGITPSGWRGSPLRG